MFNRKMAFKVRDFGDYSQAATPENVERFYSALMLFEGEALMCEGVNIGELEHFYIGDELALPNDQITPVHGSTAAMFEAVTSTKAALIRTMRAFTRKLNMQLSSSGISAGVNDAQTADDDSAANTAGGAEISPVRRVGGVPIVVARIPLSDGQSVSIVFQSPTAQTGQLQNNDLLVAFRFLLNKRDITHTVAPQGGVDASLTAVTLMISKLIERNSPKFAKTQAQATRMRDAIAERQTALDALSTQQTQLVQQGDSLVTTLAQQDSDITAAQKKLQTQQDINAKLQDQLALLRATRPEPEPTPKGMTTSEAGLALTALDGLIRKFAQENPTTAPGVFWLRYINTDFPGANDSQYWAELPQQLRFPDGTPNSEMIGQLLKTYYSAPMKPASKLFERYFYSVTASTPRPKPEPTPPAGDIHVGTKKPTDTTPTDTTTKTELVGALPLPDLATFGTNILENFAHHLQVAVDALNNTVSDLLTQSRDRALYNLEYAGDEIRNDRINETPDVLRQLIMPYLDRPTGKDQDILARRAEAVDIALDVVKSELKKRAVPPVPAAPKTLELPDPATLDDIDTVSNTFNALKEVTGLLQDVFTAYQQHEPGQVNPDMQSKVSRLENTLAETGIDGDTIAKVSDFLALPTSNDTYAVLEDIKTRFDQASVLQQAYENRLIALQNADTGKNSNHLNLPDPATITNRQEVIAILGFMQLLRSFLDDMAGYFATKTLVQARQNASDIISAQKPRWERQGIPEDVITQATALLLPNEGGRKQPIIDDLKARKADIEKQIPAWDAQNQKLKAAALADAPARIALESAIRDAKRVITDSTEFEADSDGEIVDQQSKLEAAIKVLTDNGVTGWDDDIEMARYELSRMLKEFKGELTPEDTLGEVISDLERAGIIVSQKDQDALRNNPGLVNDIYDEFRAAQTAWRNGGARYDTEKEAMKAWAEAKLRGEPRPKELTTGADKFMEFMRRSGVGLSPHVYDMIMKYPDALSLAELSSENAYNDPEWVEGDAANNKRLLEAYIDGALDDFKEPDNRTQEEKDLEQAIATLQEIQRDPSAEMGQMREDRQLIRDAVATLKAAGKYDENEALVNATIDYVAQKMISVARGVQ